MKSWIARLWCRAMHRRPMWPIHGKYTCPICMQEYAVGWAKSEDPPKTPPGSKRTSVAPLSAGR
jgi:hypothetical protein